MDSGLISKIQKAKRYAQERNRIHFKGLEVEFDGRNNSHMVRLNNEQWECNCEFFQARGLCSHTMALEKVLEGMLPEAVA